MMNKGVPRSCLDWKGVTYRVIVDHFMNKKKYVSIMVVYVPVAPTEEDGSD